MFDTSRLRSDFSKAALRYNEHALLQHTVRQRLWSLCPTIVKPSGVILDAGCGTGMFVREQAPSASVIQLDMAYAMCQHASYASAPSVCADMNKLPFASERFDAAFSSLALQWCSDRKHAMAEMCRVVRPRGWVACAYFVEGTLRELHESFAEIDDAMHVSSFAPPDTVHTEAVTQYVKDVRGLMQHLKAIGARHKDVRRRQSVMTPAMLGRLQNIYEKRFGTAQGLPVSWVIEYRMITV